MTAGFLLSLLLGVVWAALGASVAQARRKGCPICCFYTVGTATAALLAWCALGFRMPGSAGELRLLLPYLTAAAFFNSLGQMIAMYNLKASGRVLAYALPQTNFIFPFLFAGLFLGGIISLWNLIGIVLIVAGICLPANGRQDKEKKAPVFCFPAGSFCWGRRLHSPAGYHKSRCCWRWKAPRPLRH